MLISDISDINAALLLVKYDAYNNLELVDGYAVAEAFRDRLPVDDTGTAVALTYKSLATIKADIDAAIAAIAK